MISYSLFEILWFIFFIHMVVNGQQPVPDQSPTSRRPTAKPSCDSSATSANVMNFGRGEVAERLQCMSDWGFKGQYVVFYVRK